MTKRQIPSKELSGILAAVPASPTSFNSVETWVEMMVFTNTSAGALTVTVSDKQGSPLDLVSSLPIATKNTVVLNFSEPCQRMNGGITWGASGSGVVGSIFGYMAG